MIHRRSLLRGLFATPAIVAASSLMPLRGLPMRPGKFYLEWQVVGLEPATYYSTEELVLSGIIQCNEHDSCWRLIEPPVLKTIRMTEPKYREAMDRIINELQGQIG